MGILVFIGYFSEVSIMKKRFPAHPLPVVIAAAAVLWIAAVLTLYNLGRLLGSMDGLLGADTASMLGGIFSALKTAEIRPSANALFAVGAIYLLLTSLCRKRWLNIVLSPLFLLAGYGGALWFASVNEICFGDVVLSLITMIGNGLFDVI